MPDGENEHWMHSIIADLLGGKVFLVLLPATPDTIAGLTAITGLLFGSFVGIVFLHCLLRVVVAKPFRVLLQSRGVVKGMGIRWASSA